MSNGVLDQMTDAELATKVRMLTRWDLDHELVCVAGRDRIIKLSRDLQQLRASAQDAVAELAETRADRDRLLIASRQLAEKLEGTRGFEGVCRELDRRFGCEHTQNGPEDAMQLVRHVDDLRKALEFYANPHNYGAELCPIGKGPDGKEEPDMGRVARVALGIEAVKDPNPGPSAA